MPEPMNIQISFQGGGARLALLLAAAEAIRELESGPEPLIKVTRIAGTSAGAIIGAFLAGGLDLNQIRMGLASGEGADLLKNFKVPGNWITKRWAAIRLAGGARLWKDTALGEWLRKQFEGISKKNHGKPVCIEHLAKELIVVSTNLDSGTPHKHTSGDLVTALLQSAGLPFCFRTWARAATRSRWTADCAKICRWMI